MIHLPQWKIGLIIFVCVIGILYSAPNLLGSTQVAWLRDHTPSFFPNQTVNLGLDLRGGSHLLLEVETDVVIDEHMESVVDEVRKTLRKARIGYTDLRVAAGVVRFQLVNPLDEDAAYALLDKMDREREYEIDFTDGAGSLRMKEAKIAERKRATVDQSIETVRRRIDETGTREPSIQRQGDSRILVQLPGVDDPQRIKRLLGQTAKLTFRLVDRGANPYDPQPSNREVLPSAEDPRVSYVVYKKVMVDGRTLQDSQPSFQDGMPVVSFRFDSFGASCFGEATRENVGELFAIILDGKVISAPVIREPIVGGSGVISGNFTTQSAQDLALLLRSGALPAPITILEERTVGPGLGADSIRAGATACMVGLGLVVIFFVITYGLFGLFANVALLFNIALIFAVLSILQATLTLPGIAGIILTIGMAFDANVLVFERIREEMRLGRSVAGSIDAGFGNALSAIVDANLTTLIASILLFIYGSGPVKGFAVTLSIGVLTSIFSALMITRLIIVLWMKRTKPKHIPL